jgi:hypothetical protein
METYNCPGRTHSVTSCPDVVYMDAQRAIEYMEIMGREREAFQKKRSAQEASWIQARVHIMLKAAAERPTMIQEARGLGAHWCGDVVHRLLKRGLVDASHAAAFLAEWHDSNDHFSGLPCSIIATIVEAAGAHAVAAIKCTSKAH